MRKYLIEGRLSDTELNRRMTAILQFVGVPEMGMDRALRELHVAYERRTSGNMVSFFQARRDRKPAQRPKAVAKSA